MVRSTSLGRREEELLERFPDGDSLFFEGRWHRSNELAGRARRAANGFRELGVRVGTAFWWSWRTAPKWA